MNEYVSEIGLELKPNLKGSSRAFCRGKAEQTREVTCAVSNFVPFLVAGFDLRDGAYERRFLETYCSAREDRPSYA